MDDNPEFTQALETVLHDLRAEGAVLPRVSVAADYGLMLHDPDGSGHGIRWLEDGTHADRLANLADQVQEWAVEALWSAGAPAVWPHCPQHPNSHPLAATTTAAIAAAAAVADATPAAAAVAAAGADIQAIANAGAGIGAAGDAAVWTCPKTGAVVARVGELPGAGEPAAMGTSARVRKSARSRATGAV